jgi:hypothetical protein
LRTKLKNAIQATFGRRRTALPKEMPPGLSPEFVSDAGKQSQWQAFIRRSRLVATNLSLESVVKMIAAFIMPLFVAAVESKSFRKIWPKGGPWQEP